MEDPIERNKRLEYFRFFIKENLESIGMMPVAGWMLSCMLEEVPK
jgi:hypothetical protein